MTIRITTWRPDTCDCELHYSWDDQVSEDARVHTPIDSFTHPVTGSVHSTKKCSAHTSVTDVTRLHTAVLKENRLKNKMFAHAMELDALGVDVTLDDGSNGRKLKPGVSVDFQFTGDGENRKLSYSISGASLDTNSQKALDKVANG